MTDAVSFDALDLPGYAGRLFDQYEQAPRTLRLTHWYQLERPHGAALRVLVEGNRKKIAALAAAQVSGELDDRYAPVELLAMVRGIAMAWHNLTPELSRSIPRSRARRREVVVDTVRRLTGA